MTNPGVRLPAHLTASGRAMLAAMPGEQLAAPNPGPEAFPSRYELLVQIRERGFS